MPVAFASPGLLSMAQCSLPPPILRVCGCELGERGGRSHSGVKESLQLCLWWGPGAWGFSALEGTTLFFLLAKQFLVDKKG